ncbi:MAG: hypothetical protein KUL88_04515 [Rhizobium sp.]|nr:hypothetical protein [Rhizobium sp.]
MVNRSARNPGQLLRLEAEGRVSSNVPSAAIYTGQAFEALAGAAGGLSARLGKLADEAAAREGQMEGLTIGQQSGAAYLQAKAIGQSAAGYAGTGPWQEQAKAILRKEEGFQESPYWDVNAHRAGYGSDTAVTADGKVVRVTSGMKISREDAERDLNYRLTQREGAQAQKQLAGIWDKLPDNAKAGLASVAYNYGSLPKNIVAAARGGDVNAIADAVAALPANAKRRQREAAIIRGTATPNNPTSPAPSVPEAAQRYQTATLSTEPLALRRDGTIRGQAFDEAAAGAYAWRMQEGLSNELFAAHQQFADQPEEFAAAVSDIRAKYGADPNLSDPVMREAFDKSFTQKSEAYARDVAAKYEARVRQEQLVSFSDGLTAAQVDLERQAQVLGANPEGDAILAGQVAKLGASIDGAVESGTITPAQAADLKDKLALTAARGRIQGVFEALPTPERKEQYSLAILDDWKAGKGPLAKLPYATVKAMSDTMRRDAREEINLKIAANKTEAIKLSRLADDDIASMQATGKGLDPSSGLTPERVLELTGEQGLAEWQAAREKAGRIYDATSGMEKQSAGDIAERLAMIRPKPGEPGYAEELEIYGLAEKQAREILKERETDPLGQAARGGAIELAAIDATSPEALQQSLGSRREAQATVAGLYGQAVPFFRPGEKEALSSALATNPEALSAFAFTVRDVFGKDTPKVLAEIAPEAPIIAHAAGLSLATGDNSVAADVANTLAMKREKVFTAKMPSEAELSTRASMELGGALSANPRTQGALVQTANVLFEHMANTQGFNAADIKTEGSAAQAAYGRALERAAGGRTIGGVAYGGLAEVNGQTIIVPSDMPKDAPQKLMENLTQEQLDFLPPIDAGDYMLDIGDIRRGTLIADGDGLYRVALGDPLSDDPRYLATPDGRYWRLDIRALQGIAQTMPGRAGSFGDQNLNPFGWQAPR